MPVLNNRKGELGLILFTKVPSRSAVLLSSQRILRVLIVIHCNLYRIAPPISEPSFDRNIQLERIVILRYFTRLFPAQPNASTARISRFADHGLIPPYS